MAGSKVERIQYFNPAQMRSYTTQARIEYSIVGRGSGKTTGIQAPRLKNWAEKMPRGMIGLVGASYMQLLTRVLPGIIKGWRELGWIEGRDFWIGEYAPKYTGVDKPFKSPLKTDYLVHTKHGSGISLFSQDKAGMSNGVDLVAFSCDEAKYINKARLDEEIKPALRGEEHLFGHLSCYHGELYTSDMPSHSSGMWLLDKKPTDASVLKLIEKTQRRIWEIDAAMLQYEESYRIKLLYQRNNLEKLLEGLRAKCVMVNMASSLQNLHVLGVKWLEHMLDTLPDYELQSSILGLKVLRGVTSFYNELDLMKHGYQPTPSKYILSLGFNWQAIEERDFRSDEEYDWDVNTLDISIDSGGTFNCLVVGANYGRRINLINSFYRHHPGKIKDVVTDFKKYFQHKPVKKIRFHFDQTAIATRAETEYCVRDIVVNALEDNEYGKWYVEQCYMRQTPSYKWRFETIASLCKGEHSSGLTIAFNALNCEAVYESCIAANVLQIGSKLEKDKSSEKRDGQGKFKVSQEKATHLSEAFDLLIAGVLRMDHTTDVVGTSM